MKAGIRFHCDCVAGCVGAVCGGSHGAECRMPSDEGRQKEKDRARRTSYYVHILF